MQHLVLQHMSSLLTGLSLTCMCYVQDLSSKSAKKIQKKTIGCGEDDPGVVVSVMLPSKTEGSDTEYTSIDQLYVVVLTPGVKYSTYSCLLPKPILV